MARTKQTARKSTGGRAPRAQLNAASDQAFRTFLRNQQATGDNNVKRIFVNAENTFSQFSFTRKSTDNEFTPNIALAKVQEPVSVNIANPVSGLSNPETSLYLRLDFNSKFDGNIDLVKESRSPIDINFVIDISGSMGSQFPDDSDRRNKLTVAKECLLKVLERLTPKDRFSIMTFSTVTHLIFPLTHFSKTAVSNAAKKLASISPCGGTNLTRALTDGFEVLSDADDASNKGSKKKRQLEDVESGNRLKRVFFLTDMESTKDDELGVIAIATKHAVIGTDTIPNPELMSVLQPPRKSRRIEELNSQKVSSSTDQPPQQQKQQVPSHLTILGIGVDLSATTVDKLSALSGAKYMSVINANEFENITKDFDFDITPVAFDIHMKLNHQHLSFVNGLGSSELNQLTAGSRDVRFSCEFPSAKEDGKFFGGIYLFKLDTKNLQQGDRQINLTFTWYDRFFQPQSHEVTVPIPSNVYSSNYLPGLPVANSSSSSLTADDGIRKAVSLSKYVNALTDYAFDSGTNAAAPSHNYDYSDDDDEEEPAEGNTRKLPSSTPSPVLRSIEEILSKIENPAAFEESIQSWQLDSLFLSPNVSDLKNTIRWDQLESIFGNMTVTGLLSMTELWKNIFYAWKFSHLKAYLIHELSSCGDDSYLTSNQNIIQTIDQIIAFAKKSTEEKFLNEIKKCFTLLNIQKNLKGSSSSSSSSNVMDKADENKVKGFLCPITMTLMSDPVVAADGFTYERAAIEEWLGKHDTSPLTNEVLSNKQLTANLSLRAVIQEFSAQKMQN